MESVSIERIWSPVHGHPAWSVRRGHGSFLTFEFGAPALRIREPVEARDDASERTRASLARRRVHPVGQWHLWIYCCNWVVLDHGVAVAHDAALDDEIAAAVGLLDGQKIVSVAHGEAPGTWTFRFDLGGELRTSPYRDDPGLEQWHLYERDSGCVLSVRGDDRHAYGPGDRSPDDQVWLPL